MRSEHKKSIIKILLALMVVLVIIIFVVNLLGRNKKNAETTSDMVSFLAGIGISVESEPTETKKVSLPKQFGAAYSRYNDMQKAAGFDLSPYRGKDCEQITFKANDDYGTTNDVFVNLLIYDENIIGGDICSYSASGFMHPLISNKK